MGFRCPECHEDFGTEQIKLFEHMQKSGHKGAEAIMQKMEEDKKILGIKEKKSQVEGWTWLRNSPKWHYFKDGRSLCNKFALFRNPDEGFELGKEDSPDNCKSCLKKLQKLKGGGFSPPKH